MASKGSESDRASSRDEQDAISARLLREWFESYRPALLTYFLRRTRNAADAEDLTQDVFVRLSRLGAGADIHDAHAFVFRTAANLLRDRARRRLTHPILADMEGTNFDPTDGEPDPERVLEAKEELSEVVHALDTLSEKTRRIFILRRLEQMKCQDIAALYGISVKAVEHHIAKALAHISKAVTRP